LERAISDWWRAPLAATWVARDVRYGAREANSIKAAAASMLFNSHVLTTVRASAFDPEPVCVACGGSLGVVRPVGAARLAGCERCGTRTAVPRPCPHDLTVLHDSPAYFNKEYFEARRDAEANTIQRLSHVQRLVRDVRGESFLSGRRMLDVGCDTGDFVLAARAVAGIEPFGVDVSRRAAGIASRRGVIVSPTDLSDAPADFKDFALVTAIDVIEHLVEPVNLLADVASRLASDGLVYLETPNWTSAVYRIGERLAVGTGGRPRAVFERLFPPEHVQYFTPDGIRALVARTPLRPLHVATRRLSFAAVAGGPFVRAATALGQLPDRGRDRRILICALLSHRGRAT
jgi:SAM-dependent methyltransferase